MPINTYSTPDDAVRNAAILYNAGCNAVKIEGAVPEMANAIISSGVPVMGHLGLTPQTLTKYHVQGKTSADANRIREGALALEKAGCFSVLLELVFSPLASEITKCLKVPTIGIGSGPLCDGQVLVYNDLLGIFNRFKPKFVRRYKELRFEMIDGCQNFINDVKSGKYPSESESYSISK